MRVERKDGRGNVGRGGRQTGVPGRQPASRGLGQVAPAFGAQLDEARARVDATAEELLAAVDRAAVELARDQNRRTLRLYLESVRTFMSWAISATYQVQEQRRFDRRGNRVVEVLVRTIDEQLESLTREVVASGGKALGLAARLDQLRGLLLDLYQ